MRKIRLNDGTIKEFPDGTSNAEINRWIKEHKDASRTTDLLGATKHGFWEGIAELPYTAAGTVGLAGDVVDAVIPGEQEPFQGAEDWLRKRGDETKALGGDVKPDTFMEKVISGVAAAPGTLGSMAPFYAASAAAIPAGATGAAVLIPALAFGAHSAARHGGEGLGPSVGHGLRGAAEGALFGKAGQIAGRVGSPLMRRLGHGLGAAAVGGGSAAASGAEGEDIAASAAVMGALGLYGKKPRVDPKVSSKRQLQEIRDRLTPEYEARVKAEAEAKEMFGEEQPIGGEFPKVGRRPDFIRRPGRDKSEVTESQTKTFDALQSIGREKLLADERLVLPHKRTAVDVNLRAQNEVSIDGSGRPLFSLENVDAGMTVLNKIVFELDGKAKDYTRRIMEAGDKGMETAHLKSLREQTYIDLFDAVNQLTGARSAVSSALRMSRYSGDNVGLIKAKSKALKFLKSQGSRNSDIAELLHMANGDPKTILDISRAANTPHMADYLYEYWMNGLLSGIPTHVVNNVSNAFVQQLEWVEKAGAIPIDMIRAKRTGTPREHNVYSLRGHRVGAGKGFIPAWKAFLAAAKDEMYEHKAIWYDKKSSQRITNYNARVIPGKVGEVTRMSSRLLRAADLGWKTQAAWQEGYSEAYRLAGKELAAGKITKEQVEPYAENIMKNLHLKENVGVLQKMQEGSEVQTFTDKATPFAQWILKAREFSIGDSGIKPLAWVLPFVTTPWNIMRYAAKRSPLTWLMPGKLKELKQMAKDDPARFSKEVSAITIGHLMTAGMFGLAQAGIVTGGGPADWAEKANLMTRGWKPYSFKLPWGDYVSLQRVEPLGTILGLAADASEIYKAGGEGADTDELFGKALAAVNDNLTNKTFLMGMNNFINAISHPKMYGPSYLKQQMGSMVPSMVGKAAAAIDPISRQTDAFETVHGVPEAIAARVPFLSQELPARKSATGDPIERWQFSPDFGDSTTAKVAEAAITMFNPSAYGQNRPERVVAKEFHRLRRYPGIPPRMPKRSKTLRLAGLHGERVKLTDEEYVIYDEFHKRAEQHLARLIKRRGWSRVPDDMRAKIISDIYSKYRSVANKRVNASIRRRARR